MALFPTREGMLEIPDRLVAAVARQAERQADLTVAALDASGLFPKLSELQLPAAFLLDLGATLQIGVWERQGLREHLPADLPSYRDAAADLARRATEGPSAFSGLDSARLSRRVMQVGVELFAWAGEEFLQADIIVGDVDEESFVDLLAEFLFTHRHQLTNVLPEEGETK